MSVVFGDVAIGTEKNKNVAENGLIVTATFTELDKTFLGINTQYVLRYYYKDDNGVEYTGTTTYMYELKEEAEKHIGEKVQIKIDGKGHSMFADYNPPSPVLFWVLCVLCILAVVILVFVIILNTLKIKKRNIG